MSKKLMVKSVNNSYGVYACSKITKNELVIPFNACCFTNSPSRYSVQIDVDKHIDIPLGEEKNEKYIWRFTNHSCNPNCYFDKERMGFAAMKNIAPNEEINFDYNSTEYEMAEPFKCTCQSEKCIQHIKGYKYLSEEQKRKMTFTAQHVINQTQQQLIID